MESTVIARPRCEKCGSAHVYVRIMTGEVVCQNCGYVEPVRVGSNNG